MTAPITNPSLELGAYRHAKSGKLYEVIGVALHTETDERLVVYRALYETEDGIVLFTRPYEMFVEVVEINGASVPRFEMIKPSV